MYEVYSTKIVWIRNSKELGRNAGLVERFFDLYEHPSNFPDEDEREDRVFIKERILEGASNPYTHLMAYLLIAPDGKDLLVGGCIVEFYPESSCSLVTYLFVDRQFRGIKMGNEQKKIAETLILSETGLKGLVGWFCEHYKQNVNAVFFESNNPEKTAPENDSMPPKERLKFFDRIGGKRISFEYIQPPLGEDKGIVTNLFLLIFPALTGLRKTIPIKVVMKFILELTRSLDRNKDSDSLLYYGENRYAHDINALEQEHLANNNIMIETAFLGLKGSERNIIQEMYINLVLNKVNETEVPLIEIF